MSKVKIQGNATGTGIFTVAAPATNTDRTITLPDVDATVMTTNGGNFTQNIGIAVDGYPALKFRNAAGTDKAEIYVGSSAGDLNVVVNAQTAISIDSSARVRKPYQPFARVYRRSGSNPNLSSGQTIVFNNADVNIGSCYSTSTGRFTCPISGTYLMMSKIELNSGASDWAYNYMACRNGSALAATYEAKPSASYWGAHTVAIIECSVNDYLEFKIGTNITIQHEDNPGDTRNYAMFYLLG